MKINPNQQTDTERERERRVRKFGNEPKNHKQITTHGFDCNEFYLTNNEKMTQKRKRESDTLLTMSLTMSRADNVDSVNIIVQQ